MRKPFYLASLSALIAALASCSNDNFGDSPVPALEKSIVILYENDVHCGVDGHGYSKIAGLRNAINQTDTAECLIVSSGDFLQGGQWGALSRGEYIVNLMNAVGYTTATIGNHEFDYGTPRMLELFAKTNFSLTGVNFSKAGSTEQIYKPYVMTNVSGKKVAFVGILTPQTLSSEWFAFYDENKNLLYDLYPNDYIRLTQMAVDAARGDGADYVVALSHLGEQDNGYSSGTLIKSTSGIDVMLDGHTHSVIPDSSATNKDGKAVPFSQTGTQYANIGKLVITQSGAISTELLPTADITYLDSRVESVHDSISNLVSSMVGQVLGTSDHELSIKGPDGKRAVRNAETTIGNFCSDAYRYCMQAQIGLSNGGGMRTGIPAGSVTYGSFVDVHPFFNDMESRELTGAQLRRMLTKSYSLLPAESGSFLHVSGLKIQIEMASGTPTITDIQVQDKATGTYAPLDDSKTYDVACTSYFFGRYDFLNDCKKTTPVIMKDTEALKQYFVEYLKGDMGDRYKTTENRIQIK